MSEGVAGSYEERKIHNFLCRIQHKYDRDLYFLSAELCAVVCEVLWLLPGPLSVLQIVVVVITSLDLVFHPHTITAACCRGNNTAYI